MTYALWPWDAGYSLPPEPSEEEARLAAQLGEDGLRAIEAILVRHTGRRHAEGLALARRSLARGAGLQRGARMHRGGTAHQGSQNAANCSLWPGDRCMHRIVVDRFVCPASSWMTLASAPRIAR